MKTEILDIKVVRQCVITCRLLSSYLAHGDMVNYKVVPTTVVLGSKILTNRFHGPVK
jgi:hypothetical protein